MYWKHWWWRELTVVKPFVPEKWILLFLIVLAEKEPSKARSFPGLCQYHVSAYSSYLWFLLSRAELEEIPQSEWSAASWQCVEVVKGMYDDLTLHFFFFIINFSSNDFDILVSFYIKKWHFDIVTFLDSSKIWRFWIKSCVSSFVNMWSKFKIAY